MKHKTPKLLGIIAAILLAVKLFAADTNAPALNRTGASTPPKAALPTPGPELDSTNASQMPSGPVKLQSAQAAQKPAPAPKPVGIVMRDVLVIQTPQGPLAIVPERYVRDLTNLYRSVLVPKLVLEE